MEIATPKLPFKVKAVYSWSGEKEYDLGFIEEDIIEVTKAKGGWYYGRLLRNKKSGSFPANYVTIIKEKYNDFGTQSSNSNMSSISRSADPPSPKIVVPPIPTRSSNKSTPVQTPGLTQSKTTGFLETSPKRFEQVSDLNSRLKERALRQRQPCSPRSSLPQSYSTSQLPSVSYQPEKLSSVPSDERIMPSQSRAKDDNAKAVRREEMKKLDYFESKRRGIYSQKVQERPDTLPPLPPIPVVSTRSNQAPPKSFSYNDLSVNKLQQPRSRNSYYRSNEDFYDGYYPSSSEKSSSNLFSHSRYMQDSLTSSEESFALMSDFSATSAGSLARHRFAKSFTDSFERSEISMNNSISEECNMRSSNRFGGIIKKLLPRAGSSSPTTPTADYPKLPDIQNLQVSSSNNEASDWIQVNYHLNRANTLSSREKHDRQRRALEENCDLVLDPQRYIMEDMNTNEVKHRRQPGLVDIELNQIDIAYIDQLSKKRGKKDGIQSVESFAQHTFSSRFKTPMEKLRALFVFCTETYNLIDDNGKTDFGKEPTNLSKVMHKAYCTPYELTWIFKRMANALDVICEIVVGFLKTPNADNTEFKFNHCWLRLLINDEWRFVDVILGNVTNPIHEYVNNKPSKKAEDYYFLTEPLKLIYTHIPYFYEEQHIVPVVDKNIALCIPTVFPSFFKNDLKLYKFSNGLSKLEDSEVYECSLFVPNDVEVFSSVTIESDSNEKYKSMDLSLVQTKWHKNRRIASIKAVLPPGTSTGTLHIHSGVKSLQTSLANVHPLSFIIPLEHRGSAKEYEFVVRVPPVTAQKVDLYIKKPQNKYLFSENEYTFQIIQHPSDGLVYESSAFSKKKHTLALQSPSGKIYHLTKNDPNFEYGTWEASVKVNEPGVWIGVVTADSGIGWCPYAEWRCL